MGGFFNLFLFILKLDQQAKINKKTIIVLALTCGVVCQDAGAFGGVPWGKMKTPEMRVGVGDTSFKVPKSAQRQMAVNRKK